MSKVRTYWPYDTNFGTLVFSCPKFGILNMSYFDLLHPKFGKLTQPLNYSALSPHHDQNSAFWQYHTLIPALRASHVEIRHLGHDISKLYILAMSYTSSEPRPCHAKIRHTNHNIPKRHFGHAMPKIRHIDHVMQTFDTSTMPCPKFGILTMSYSNLAL